MDIKPDAQFREQLLKKIADREFKERKGVHGSDLIYCLNKAALRRLKPLPIDDNDLLLFSLGWSTQRWLTGQAEDEPEREVNGIIVTCDALTDVSEEKVVLNRETDARGEESTLWHIERKGSPWELKATFQSSERPIAENVHWIRQIMGQCYVTKSTTAYLTRMEIMGNWKSIFGKKEEKSLPENRKPTLSAYRLEFSQDELERNWLWLLGRRDKFLAILESGQLLPKIEAIPSGQDWECSRCSYAGKECKGG